MANEPQRIGGIERVPVPESFNLYTSRPTSSSGSSDAQERMAQAQRILERTLPTGPSGARGSLSIDPTLPENLRSTQQAAQRVLNGANMLVYDLETFGTPNQNRIGSSAGTSLFDIGQISLFEYNPNEGVTGQPNVLPVRLQQSTVDQLTTTLNQLERDPSALHTLSEDMRRSVVDLGLYADESHFTRRTLGGQEVSVMTGQGDRVNYKGMAMVSSDNIAKYRRGLENLTNPNLTNDTNTVLTVMDNYTQNNPVLAGHNVNRFDQPAFVQWAQDSGVQPNHPVLDRMRQPQYDSLPLAQNFQNQDGLEVENFQLGTLFRTTPAGREGSMQAHFAGDDTVMNAHIINQQINQVKEGRIQLGGGSQTVQQNDLFFAESGTGSFFPSSFTRNRGQYDTTFRWSEEQQQWTTNYGFQEPGVVAGHTYSFVGELPMQNINGVEYHSILLEDVENQTYKMINRQNQDEINDLFSNHLVRADQLDNTQKEFIREDSQRRFYQSLFDPKGHTPVARRVGQAYDTINMYDEVVSEMSNGGPVDEVMRVRAIKEVQDRMNADKEFDSQYRFSYEKIDKTIGLRERLLEEEPLWRQAISDSESVMGHGVSGDRWANTQRQNLFIHDIYSKYTADDQQAQEYGYDSMRRMRIPNRSIKGEATYLNVESPTRIEAHLRNTVSIGTGKGRSSALEDLDRTLRNVPNLDDETRIEFWEKARKELQQNGKVSPGTLRHMSHHMHKLANEADIDGQNIVASIPGFNIRPATETQNSGRSEFINNLKSNDNELYQSWVQEAQQNSFRQLHTASANDMIGYDIANLSNPAMQRLKRSQEITERLEEQVFANSTINGLNGKPKTDILAKVNTASKLQETLKAFDDEGFQTAVNYTEADGTFNLFFSHSDSNIDLSTLSPEERLGTDGVHSVVLPILSDTAGVPVPGAQLRNNYSLGRDRTTGKWTMRSTQDEAWNQLRWMPKNIQGNMESAQQIGQRMSPAEAQERGIRSYTNRLTGNAVVNSYHRQALDEAGLLSSSLERNMSSMLDMSEYMEDYARRNMPDAYREFQNFQRNNPNARFMEDQWAGFGTSAHIRQAQAGAMLEWNTTIREETGVQLTPNAVNANQWRRGFFSIQSTEARNYALGGQANPATREQILKVSNYHMMDREPLEEYFAGVPGADRILNPMQSEMTQSTGQEQGIRRLGLNTAFTDDRELYDFSQQTIEELQAELRTATDERKREIENDIAFLQAGNLTVYEEQSLIRESLLSNLRLTDEFSVNVNQNEELDERFLDYIREQASEDVSFEGQIRFDRPMNYHDMQRSGLVNEHDMLTIGNIVEEQMQRDGETLSTPGQRKRIYEDSMITGVNFTDNGVQLNLTQSRRGEDGFKLINAQGGTRRTAIGVPDRIFDRLEAHWGQENIHTINEHIKTSRRPTGQMFAVLMQTAHRNVMDDFEAMYDNMHDVTDYDFRTEAARDWFAQNDVTKFENKTAARQSFLQHTFLNEMGQGGMSDLFQLNSEEAGGLTFRNQNISGLMSGVQGAQNYLNVEQTARERFGFTEKNALFIEGAHNVNWWHGTGKSPRWSTREMGILEQSFGQDSAVVEGMQRLYRSRQRGEVKEYSRELQSVLENFSGTDELENIQQAGNVVVDMTGELSDVNGNVVERFNEAGESYFMVDGLSIPQAPDLSDRVMGDLPGTTADPMNYILNNEELGIENVTVGDLVKQNGGQAILQIQNPAHHQTRTFERNYVQLHSVLNTTVSGADGSRLHEADKAQERLMNEVMLYNTAIFDSETSAEDRQRRTHRMAENVNEATRMIRSSAANFNMTSLPNELLTVQDEHGVSGLLGSFNRVTQQGLEQNQLGDFFVSRGYAGSMIEGIEENILRATGTDLSTFENSQQMHQHILESMEDGTIDVRGIFNRFPTQSEGNLAPGRIRVDRTMENDDTRIMMDAGTAVGAHADFDGDIGYLSLGAYASTDSEQELQRIQSELDDRSADFRTMAARRMELGGGIDDDYGRIVDSFQGLRQDIQNEDGSINTDSAAFQEMFQDQEGFTSNILGVAKNATEGYIGMADNTMVGARSLLREVGQAAMQEGVMSQEDYAQTMESWNQANDMFVQNFISAKKLDPTAMPFDLNGMDPAEQTEAVLGFMDNQQDTISQIRSLRTSDDVDNLMGSFRDIGLLSGSDAEENEQIYREGFGAFARANSAAIQSGMSTVGGDYASGLTNPALAVGRSSAGERHNEQLMDFAQNHPENLIHTNDLDEWVSSTFADQPEVIEQYQETATSASQQLAQNFQDVTENFSAGTSGVAGGTSQAISDTMSEQVDQMAGLLHQSKASQTARTGEAIRETVGNVLQETAGSTAFQAAAGFSAMWMLSSAIRRGPTPEGNEAQQEATREEVAPSEMLTSPTARVTPNTESINLNISGRGNIDQNALAGIVNHEVGEMTGMPMQMNMNLTDNTQRLDRGFYQRTINDVLGI